MFAKSFMDDLNSIPKIFGAEVCQFLSNDDKAKCPLGLAAAKIQSPILMHMEYKVHLPDHDFVVASRHHLTPLFILYVTLMTVVMLSIMEILILELEMGSLSRLPHTLICMTLRLFTVKNYCQKSPSLSFPLMGQRMELLASLKFLHAMYIYLSILSLMLYCTESMRQVFLHSTLVNEEWLPYHMIWPVSFYPMTITEVI